MKFNYLSLALAALMAWGASVGPVEAQATRTWVSGVGDDANPCSRTAPCNSFSGAISKTAGGGEINCLDPGGFGSVTITVSISIVCLGVEVGVLVSGTNGITINAAPSDQIVLQGLDLEGLNSGIDGINIQSAGEVVIKDCNIHRLSGNGVTVATSSSTRVIIRRSVISENSGSGVVVNSLPGFGHVKIFSSLIHTNANDGVQINGVGNDSIISDNEIIGNHRQLNISVGVAGGTINSLGNNVIPAGSGDVPTPMPLQ